jgi:hypothetical protein
VRLPYGMIDDLTVSLPPGRTLEELVDRIIQNTLAGVPDSETDQHLKSRFRLSPEKARLARERTLGGILRAARNSQHLPDQVKDPVAWVSFQRAIADPSIVTRISDMWAKSPEPVPAREHPKQCRFCGSTEFWHAGFFQALGRDESGVASWTGYTVRCAKCAKLFEALDTRSPLDHTTELVWERARHD